MISNIEVRLQEELGVKLYDVYREGVLGRKERSFCDECEAFQKKRGWWGNIECERSVDERIEADLGDLPESQRGFAEQALDPVVWAAEELQWEARWYQAQAMRCTAPWQCHRWGRRTGKTNFLAIRSLHLAATKPGVGMNDPYTVLVVAPYEGQLDKIFQYMRDALAKAKTLKPLRDIRDPHLLEFTNKGKIIGFTAGEKTGARSEKIRGQDANAIVIDEADRIRADDIDAVMAILASHKDCQLFFSTTPTGLPTRFKKACEDPELGYKEFWFASYESPEYTDRSDKQFKRTYPVTTYEHEILATFGSAEGGVFMPEHLSHALKDYPLGQELRPNELAIIGVDCNDTANGTHAAVIAVNNEEEKARLVDKAIIRGEEFSKPASLGMLIQLFTKWKPILLAFDKGYSHGQFDDLSEYGLHHPESGMTEALRHYDMGSNHKWFDTQTGFEIVRPMKPLMVGISQAFLMEKRLTLPKVEDHESGIVGQMRAFHIKRKGQDGRPIYSQGNEHTLTGMMIALLAWQLEILGLEPTPNAMATIQASKANVPASLPLPMGQRMLEDDGQGLVARAIVMRSEEPSRSTWSHAPRRTGPTRRKHF